MFWLNGPLKISAIDQTKFLAKLASGTLPASNRSQNIVTDILELETSANGVLFGKTGWTTAPEPDLEWFVGWVQTNEAIHPFALNMDIHKREDAKLRKRLSMEFLRILGLY